LQCFQGLGAGTGTGSGTEPSNLEMDSNPRVFSKLLPRINLERSEMFLGPLLTIALENVMREEWVFKPSLKT
jgi:hypothetical protein